MRLSIPTALEKIGGWSCPGPRPRSRRAAWVVLAGLVTWLWARAGAWPRSAAASLATVVLEPVVLLWYFTWPLVLGAAAAWPASHVSVAAEVSTWLTVSTHPDGKTLLPPCGFGALVVVSAGVGVLTARREFVTGLFAVSARSFAGGTVARGVWGR